MLVVLVHMRQKSDFISLTAVCGWSLESTRNLFSVSDEKLLNTATIQWVALAVKNNSK